MLGAWPEPFGLVAIESMATGTPVIARRAGALPEIISHGVTGFLVDDLDEAQLAVREARGLDRRRIREEALERFGVARMVDEYEEVYRQVIADASSARARSHVAEHATAIPAPAASASARRIDPRERAPRSEPRSTDAPTMGA